MKRRTFIKSATASTAGALLAGVPQGWVGSVYADDSPETAEMHFGIIALTDCAPIVMAHELGYFKKFGINSVIYSLELQIGYVMRRQFVSSVGTYGEIT